MSLFVRVNCNFYTHRKTAKLRAALGDDALWLPPRLWAYAAEHHPDGILASYSAAELAVQIGYHKDAARMLEALLQACFLDPNPLRIHDWQDHNGYHLIYAERAKRAAAARWEKESNKGKVHDMRGEEASIASSMLQASLDKGASQAHSPPLFPRERDRWIDDLRAAIRKCPPDDTKGINALFSKLEPLEKEKFGRLVTKRPRAKAPPASPAAESGRFLPQDKAAEEIKRLHAAADGANG